MSLKLLARALVAHKIIDTYMLGSVLCIYMNIGIVRIAIPFYIAFGQELKGPAQKRLEIKIVTSAFNIVPAFHANVARCRHFNLHSSVAGSFYNITCNRIENHIYLCLVIGGKIKINT